MDEIGRHRWKSDVDYFHYFPGVWKTQMTHFLYVEKIETTRARLSTVRVSRVVAAVGYPRTAAQRGGVGLRCDTDVPLNLFRSVQ